MPPDAVKGRRPHRMRQRPHGVRIGELDIDRATAGGHRCKSLLLRRWRQAAAMYVHRDQV
ncbi:hypothetical protein CP969_03270 [Streptomyces viridosporus T7A]|uniref:Uncharacterized protein n=1 Tax=Streptomyces viridosporus T7A TaxID=665577 RepID=A0ABX6A8Z8_STRVD|nr:hypothetical protein CP969_03270 [Streptomyces viridosporus T7A]